MDWTLPATLSASWEGILLLSWLLGVIAQPSLLTHSAQPSFLSYKMGLIGLKGEAGKEHEIMTSLILESDKPKEVVLFPSPAPCPLPPTSLSHLGVRHHP